MGLFYEITPNVLSLSEGGFSFSTDYLMELLWIIFVAFLILVFGYFVAAALELVLKKLFRKSRIEDVITEHGLSGALLGFTLSGIIIAIVKWMVFLVFVATAVNILEGVLIVPGEAKVLTPWINTVVGFLPAVLKGVLILVVGFLAADLVSSRAKETVQFHGKALGLSLKLIMIYFTVVVVLSIQEYGLDAGLLSSVFESLALGISLGIAGAITLAVGLGMKDSVARIAKKREPEIEHFLTGAEE